MVASTLGLTTAAISAMASRLEAGGYARRQIDPKDRRRIVMHASPAGAEKAFSHFDGFNNAEVPIHEDLQAGAVRGNPPYLLRDGTGGNEWLPLVHRQPRQSIPYDILPFNELPQVVNPPAGFIVSANNDPTGNTSDNNMLNQVRPGGGISYVSFTDTGFRAGRITDMSAPLFAPAGSPQPTSWPCRPTRPRSTGSSSPRSSRGHSGGPSAVPRPNWPNSRVSHGSSRRLAG